jgi:hypothetical protein
MRFSEIVVLIASVAMTRVPANAVELNFTPTRTPAATRTPRPTRTATPTASPTTTGKVTTYVLSGESRFDLTCHTRDPDVSGPLVGSMDLVARSRERGPVSEFEIRRLELEGGRYRFTASGGTLETHWRNGRVFVLMAAALRIQPAPYGDAVSFVDREFTGNSGRYFSRYPPDIRRLWIFDHERVLRCTFALLIVAEPAA